MVLWFLRLFTAFTDLENLAQLQATHIEKAGNWRLKAEDAETQATSLTTDINNLRQATEELIHEKALLQDRLASAIDDKDKLWALVQESLQCERYSYHTQINHLVQRTGGGIPHLDAHSLPQNTVPKPQEPGAIGRHARQLPSQYRDVQTSQNLTSLLKMTRPAQP